MIYQSRIHHVSRQRQVVGSFHDGSIHGPPIVALRPKRQYQHVAHHVVDGLEVAWNADDNAGLRNVEPQRLVHPIPPGKNNRVVGVVLAPHVGVMNAVHPRRNEHLVEPTFQRKRKSNITVLKQRIQLEDDFIQRKSERRDAGQQLVE